MDKQAMVELWDEFNQRDTWFAGVDKAFDGLTPQQAAWKPPGGDARHSIWQILNHIAYWREVVAKRTVTNEQPSEAEIERKNWESPSDVSDASWKQARERLARSHGLIREVLASGALTWDKFKYTIPHDTYHVGQVMYVRAMQGLPVVV